MHDYIAEGTKNYLEHSSIDPTETDTLSTAVELYYMKHRIHFVRKMDYASVMTPATGWD
jgi:hypothetical protein